MVLKVFKLYFAYQFGLHSECNAADWFWLYESEKFRYSKTILSVPKLYMAEKETVRLLKTYCDYVDDSEAQQVMWSTLEDT